MRFAYLLPFGACAHHYCTSKGLVVLRDHTNYVCGVAATVILKEQCPRRFGRRLILNIVESAQGEAIPEIHLRVGKVQVLSIELSNQELGHCEGILARGSNEG